jgi:hypothetical protein
VLFSRNPGASKMADKNKTVADYFFAFVKDSGKPAFLRNFSAVSLFLIKYGSLAP